MSEHEMIKLVFGIFLLLGGFVLIFLSFTLFYKYLIQDKRCNKKTKGIVTGYTMARYGSKGSGVHLPIVNYWVDGKEYQVKGPIFKAYIVKNVTNPFHKNELEVEADEKQRLIIKRHTNTFVGIYKNPMEELYPLNSEIDVFYDPHRPKFSYVERYCDQKWVFWLTFLCGIGTWVIDLLIQILL